MQERSFAGAIGAPLRVGVDRGVADDVEDDGAAPLPRRCREGAEQSPRQTEGPNKVSRQRQLELLAFGVGEQGEWDGAEARSVVDEDIDAAQAAGDLQSDRIDVFLARQVADDAMGPRQFARDTLQTLPATRDKGDFGAAAAELTNQRKAQPRCAAGNGDPQRRLQRRQLLSPRDV